MKSSGKIVAPPAILIIFSGLIALLSYGVIFFSQNLSAKIITAPKDEKKRIIHYVEVSIKDEKSASALSKELEELNYQVSVDRVPKISDVRSGKYVVAIIASRNLAESTVKVLNFKGYKTKITPYYKGERFVLQVGVEFDNLQKARQYAKIFYSEGYKFDCFPKEEVYPEFNYLIKVTNIDTEMAAQKLIEQLSERGYKGFYR